MAEGKKGGKKKDEMSPTEYILRKFLRTYEKNCVATDSIVNPGIRQALKDGIENENLVVKFIFEYVPTASPHEMQALLAPFLTCIRNERYNHVLDLHVWSYPVTYDNIVSIANLLEQPAYKLRIVELMDCLISPPYILRFARALKLCPLLTIINLDYNEFGDEGCRNLCEGLTLNKTLLSLSLCYCGLGSDSGRMLGDIVATSAIRELYLDGNNLECAGAIELIKLLVDQAETEAFVKAEEARVLAEKEAMMAEQAANRSRYDYDGPESKPEETQKETGRNSIAKKDKKKKKKKEPPGPAPVGPWIHKLHLADNGIDDKTISSFGTFASLLCMRLFKRLIVNAAELEEIDLEDNLIGEMGGRELLSGLQSRAEGGLGGIKLRCTHRMTLETFNTIVKLGAGLKRKKGRGRKKK